MTIKTSERNQGTGVWLWLCIFCRFIVALRQHGLRKFACGRVSEKKMMKQEKQFQIISLSSATKQPEKRRGLVTKNYLLKKENVELLTPKCRWPITVVLLNKPKL